MNHKAILAHIRAAGYHDDTKRFVRLYVEQRVSFKRAKAAFDHGRRIRESGHVCDCFECKYDSTSKYNEAARLAKLADDPAVIDETARRMLEEGVI